MSLFASKRKPRAIRTFDDDGVDDKVAESEPHTVEQTEPVKGDPAPPAPLKFAKRPFKHSSLRKSINAEDAAALATVQTAAAPGSAPISVHNAPVYDDDAEGPVVVRPSLSRAGSTKQKKKRLSSRLSFGGDAADAGGDGPGAFTTPKKASLSSRALENSALRNRLPMGRQPTASNDEDDSRPRYSKEYLEELASSTPNTPRDISKLRISGDYDEEMELDLSELDGAMIVPSNEISGIQIAPAASGPSVLTEAEIRERKERRARLAREEEFMPLDGSDNEGNSDYISLRSKPKKKEESRLIAEDEDLGEGYEEFVEDGGLSLGKKAEREARKRRRAEMAELIEAAEGEGGHGDDADGSDSDDSEAERRAAYEEAQTRAGMDGMQRRRAYENGGVGSGRGIGPSGVMEIPRLKPLPDLDVCLAKMREVLEGMEKDVASKKLRITELQREKAEISTREAEVQAILDQEGKKYQGTTGTTQILLPPGSATHSPLRPMPAGFGEAAAQRGLESFGTTPTRPDVQDGG